MTAARFLLVSCLLLAAPAWADAVMPSSTSVSTAKATSEAIRQLPKIHRQLHHDQDRVKRLQHDVAKQESDSLRASQRLQRQDRAIAELRRQLLHIHSNHAAEVQH